MESFIGDGPPKSGAAADTRHEAEGQDLQDALQGEEDREGCVQVFQDGVVRRRC